MTIIIIIISSSSSSMETNKASCNSMSISYTHQTYSNMLKLTKDEIEKVCLGSWISGGSRCETRLVSWQMASHSRHWKSSTKSRMRNIVGVNLSHRPDRRHPPTWQELAVLLSDVLHHSITQLPITTSGYSVDENYSLSLRQNFASTLR